VVGDALGLQGQADIEAAERAVLDVAMPKFLRPIAPENRARAERLLRKHLKLQDELQSARDDLAKLVRIRREFQASCYYTYLLNLRALDHGRALDKSSFGDVPFAPPGGWAAINLAQECVAFFAGKAKDDAFSYEGLYKHLNDGYMRIRRAEQSASRRVNQVESDLREVDKDLVGIPGATDRGGRTVQW
jgi:hypothetical protein